MSIHENLKELLPCHHDDVPTEDEPLADYIRNIIAKAQEIVDSVPPPAISDSSSGQSQSRGGGAASTGEQVTQTDARSDAPVNEEMRKAWGKPMKFSAKENPHEMAVYKMAAKDRRGAWFARRSVHEGLGFARWKRGLDTEFEDSLKVQGKPGEGNVRGIGGEKKVMTKELPDVGKVEVFQLTAQFPGPSSPRDFVEMLVSSTVHPTQKDAPRQYLLVSRPVTHPDVPEQDGYVRGQYESVEFIREIPIRKTKLMSTTSLPATQRQLGGKGSEDEDTGTRGRSATDTGLLNTESGKISAEDAEATLEARQAQDDSDPTLADTKKDADGDTDSGVAMPVDDNDDLAPNPVEWIMISRSDPGGSVPRFMVERGTPGAIVGDAGKFLEWATQRTMPVAGEDTTQTDSTRADDSTSATSTTIGTRAPEAAAAAAGSSMATAAALQAHHLTRTVTVASTSSSSSSDSFVSADGNVAPELEHSASAATSTAKLDKTASSTSKSSDKYDVQERELDQKLELRRAKADLKLEDVMERHAGNETRIRRAQEKRDRHVDEAERSHGKEVAKVRQRREKAEKRQRESGSKSELREKIEALTKENEELRARVKELEARS